MDKNVNYLEVNRKPVKSSNIKSIGYHKESQTLIIEFHTLDVYTYHPITPDGHNMLLHADSKGGFFYKYIRNNKALDVNKIF